LSVTVVIRIADGDNVKYLVHGWNEEFDILIGTRQPKFMSIGGDVNVSVMKLYKVTGSIRRKHWKNPQLRDRYIIRRLGSFR